MDANGRSSRILNGGIGRGQSTCSANKLNPGTCMSRFGGDADSQYDEVHRRISQSSNLLDNTPVHSSYGSPYYYHSKQSTVPHKALDHLRSTSNSHQSADSGKRRSSLSRSPNDSQHSSPSNSDPQQHAFMQSQQPIRRSKTIGGRFAPSDGERHHAYVPPDDNRFNVDKHVPPNLAVFSERYKEVQVTRLPSPTVSSVVFNRIPILRERFEDCQFMPPRLRENMARLNMNHPTPIQRHCIPVVTSGCLDLCALAETGSGKTACYWLSLLELLVTDLSNDKVPMSEMTSNRCYPMAIVLIPTRELAAQVAADGKLLTDGLKAGNVPLKVSSVYGGVSLDYTCQTTRDCVVLVSTPGRLKHMVSEKMINLSKVRYVVLDEADRLLEEAETYDIEWLLDSSESGIPDVDNRITQLFSATWPANVQEMSKKYLRDQNVTVTAGKLNGANPDIEQTILLVKHQNKRDKVIELLGEIQRSADKVGEISKVLVFCETKQCVEMLAAVLAQHGIACAVLSSNRMQQSRDAHLRDFRDHVTVMVATHLAGRGLDIRYVDHVINYDLPRDVTAYIHRIGRTGRIGNRGTATSFYDPNRDSELARDLITVMSDVQQQPPEFLFEAANLEAVSAHASESNTSDQSTTRRRRVFRGIDQVTAMIDSVKNLNLLDSQLSQDVTLPPPLTPFSYNHQRFEKDEHGDSPAWAD